MILSSTFKLRNFDIGMKMMAVAPHHLIYTYLIQNKALDIINLVWAIVLSIPKVMRRPECRMKPISSHTIFFTNRFLLGIGRYHIRFIMKKLILWSVLLLLCGCESKSSRIKDKASDLLEDYIDALDNAKSKEEIKYLKEEFNRQGEILEDEMNKLQNNGDYSLKDMQDLIQDEKLKKLAEEANEAERNAYNRCNE